MYVVYYMVLLSYSFLLICSGRVDYGDKEEMYNENIRLKKVSNEQTLFFVFIHLYSDFIVNTAFVTRGI